METLAEKPVGLHGTLPAEHPGTTIQENENKPVIPQEGEDEGLTRKAIREALDAVPIGMIITDIGAKIVHINSTAKRLIQQGDGLIERGGVLSAYARRDATRLRTAIRDMITNARRAGRTKAGVVSLSRPSSEHPLHIVVKHIWCGSGDTEGTHTGPLANLFVTDPDRRMAAPANLVGPFFDLTPAESIVLERLVYGLSLQEIATTLGTSRNTVRNQLQVIFEKTGTNRQSDLIRLVLSTAVWLYDDSQASFVEPNIKAAPLRVRRDEAELVPA